MRAYERFLKYVAFPTMSDSESESVPSTKKQLALAEALAAELREMGLVGVEISEYGCTATKRMFGDSAHFYLSPLRGC